LALGIFFQLRKELNTMRIACWPTIGVLAAVAALLAPGGLLAEELTEARFQELHAELQPAADEPWRTIPWKIDLLEAQRAAAEQQKPIFIWAMDGHPLGCT
jgi:hypothetical protein